MIKNRSKIVNKCSEGVPEGMVYPRRVPGHLPGLHFDHFLATFGDVFVTNLIEFSVALHAYFLLVDLHMRRPDPRKEDKIDTKTTQNRWQDRAPKKVTGKYGLITVGCLCG